jgi:Uncharacterized membrane protein
MALKNKTKAEARRIACGISWLTLAACMAAIGLFYLLFLSKATLFIGGALLAAATAPALLGVSYLLKNVRHGRRLRIAAVALLLCAVLLAGIVLALVVNGASGTLRAEPTMVMVLGAQVRSYGPGPMLASRLNTAYAYLTEHPDLPVIVSGGQGPDEHMTEAEAMRDYLVALGIAPARIIMEADSHNTQQNLVNTRQVLGALGIDLAEEHILIISNDFHLFRADFLARRYGYDCSTHPAPPIGQSATMSSYIREIPAVLKSFLLD